MKSLIGQNVLDEIAEIASKTPKGNLVEVGVYLGGSALYLYQVAREQGRKLYLYDTFTGIPEKGDIDPHNVGDFGDSSYEAVKFAFPEAQVIKGVFPYSAVQHMYPISFAHIDCDQYWSTMGAVSYLKWLMVSGGIMWFDDYGALPGATKAVLENFDQSRLVQAKCGKSYVVMP